MTYYTGLDVSLRSVSDCIVDDKGDVRYGAKVAADVGRIIDCLRAFSPQVCKVGFEAGTLTQ
jgi:transposase